MLPAALMCDRPISSTRDTSVPLDGGAHQKALVYTRLVTGASGLCKNR